MANVDKIILRDKGRKCLKCGCSPANDGVKLFRFPKPGIRNLIRCKLWAKYVFPEKDYCSTILQTNLHTEHRMLCQKHFSDADFTDESKEKLLRHAVPCDVDLSEPQAGPSHRIALGDITNIRNPLHTAETGSQEMVLPETSSVAVQTVKMHKEKVLYAKCCRYFKQITQMRNRIRNMRSNEVLHTIHDAGCVQKLSKRITPTFALLLQSQLRNFKKKISRRRWTKEEKIVGLRIFKKSPTCYRLLRRMFYLPAPTTLKTLLNKVPCMVGINKPVFEVLKKYNKTQIPSNNEYVLMFDEMAIKKHLSYNMKEDFIEGYQDHALQGRSANIASYALVFMIAGIRQRVKQPIAHYFSSGCSTADRLTVLIKEVLQECFEAGVNIAAIVCDMDGVNRRALTILGATVDQPYIMVHNKEIVALFDTPHLLKCFRNLFMKYDIECASNISSGDEMGRGIAKWSHLKEFFALDNNNPFGFVFAPSLKNDHINPNPKQKMKVKLAAQVFSHSVAAGMYAKISGGELPAEALTTANLLANMDKLFDALNSDSADLRRGKPHATNFTKTSPHMNLFKDMKLFFGTLQYIGSSRRPPSQDGWIWTINGIERLFNNLVKKHKIKSLATRRLQQDPLENLFGCIRGNCGSNTNPTCGQFTAGLKTAILSRLAHMGTTGNCEDDDNTIINNFQSFLSVSKVTATNIFAHPEFHSLDEFNIDLDDMGEKENAEIQACAYVCGFMLKKFPINCEHCKNILCSKDVEEHHMFVECKEYSDFKKSLNYVTKDMITCVECCASVVNIYLQENAHTAFLKRNVVKNIKETVNFDFLKGCMMHENENINKIINSVFIICTKRFCTVKNRLFANEASAAALKRTMNIILHK